MLSSFYYDLQTDKFWLMLTTVDSNLSLFPLVKVLVPNVILLSKICWQQITTVMVCFITEKCFECSKFGVF